MDCASAGLGGQVVACVALGGLYCIVGAITAPSSELFGTSAEDASVSIDARLFSLQCLNGVLTLRAASIGSSAQCGLQLARTPFARASSAAAVPLLAFNSVSESNRTAARRRRERPCGAPPLD